MNGDLDGVIYSIAELLNSKVCWYLFLLLPKDTFKSHSILNIYFNMFFLLCKTKTTSAPKCLTKEKSWIIIPSEEINLFDTRILVEDTSSSLLPYIFSSIF